MLYSSGLQFSWHCPFKAKIWHLELAHSLLFYHRWLKWWDKPIYIILEIKWYKWLGMSRAGNALLQIINTAAFAGMQFTLCYRVISKLCASANIYHLKTVELINQQSYFLRYFCHWGIDWIVVVFCQESIWNSCCFNHSNTSWAQYSPVFGWFPSPRDWLNCGCFLSRIHANPLLFWIKYFTTSCFNRNYTSIVLVDSKSLFSENTERPMCVCMFIKNQ